MQLRFEMLLLTLYLDFEALVWFVYGVIVGPRDTVDPNYLTEELCW